MLTQPAVLGMMGLLLIIFTRAMVLLVGRVAALVRSTQKPSTENEAGRFDETVTNLSDAQLDAILARREGR